MSDNTKDNCKIQLTSRGKWYVSFFDSRDAYYLTPRGKWTIWDCPDFDTKEAAEAALRSAPNPPGIR